MLHISFATEQTKSGGYAYPPLLDQVSDAVNSSTGIHGWKMQKRLRIGIIDASWWDRWEGKEGLTGSKGVAVINTPTYREKLERGKRLHEQGKPPETDGMGIFREARRIIQERESNPSFKVFVIDGAMGRDPMQLRCSLQDGGDEINYHGWVALVQGSSATKGE